MGIELPVVRSVPNEPCPPHYYRVEIPCPGADAWLNANDVAGAAPKGWWHWRASLVASWRDAAGWYTRAARVPKLHRVHIVAELRFTDRRRRDPCNYYPTVKACVDGLVDVGVLHDDSADYVLGPDMRLGTTALRGGVILHIWPTENLEAA
jgi:hypothetical protein